MEFIEKDHPKCLKKSLNPPISKTHSENEDEPNIFKGEGIKIIIPANLFDFWTDLENLLGLKQSGHTDTLTEASD